MTQLLRPLYRSKPKLQDEVLREEQRKRNAFAKVCFYIAANPVRAGLMSEKEIWPFAGCVIPGYPKLNPTDDDFWSPSGGFMANCVNRMREASSDRSLFQMK